MEEDARGGRRRRERNAGGRCRASISAARGARNAAAAGRIWNSTNGISSSPEFGSPYPAYPESSISICGYVEFSFSEP